MMISIAQAHCYEDIRASRCDEDDAGRSVITSTLQYEAALTIIFMLPD